MGAVFRRVLVAFDGSASAWRALQQAIGLARSHGTELWALTVEEPLPRYAARPGSRSATERGGETGLERIQAEAWRAAARHGVALQTERVRGHAAEAIVRYADQIGADLIVIGQHGRHGRLGHVLGSTGDRIVDLAHCSVLVVREAGTS